MKADASKTVRVQKSLKNKTKYVDLYRNQRQGDKVHTVPEASCGPPSHTLNKCTDECINSTIYIYTSKPNKM